MIELMYFFFLLVATVGAWIADPPWGRTPVVASYRFAAVTAAAQHREEPEADPWDQRMSWARMQTLDARSGPRVGDYIEFNDEVVKRISHIWLVGNIRTSKGGSVWGFHHDFATTGGGVNLLASPAVRICSARSRSCSHSALSIRSLSLVCTEKVTASARSSAPISPGRSAPSCWPASSRRVHPRMSTALFRFYGLESDPTHLVAGVLESFGVPVLDILFVPAGTVQEPNPQMHTEYVGQGRAVVAWE